MRAGGVLVLYTTMNIIKILMNLIDLIDLTELKKLAELCRSSLDLRIVQCNNQYHIIIVIILYSNVSQ